MDNADSEKGHCFTQSSTTGSILTTSFLFHWIHFSFIYLANSPTYNFFNKGHLCFTGDDTYVIRVYSKGTPGPGFLNNLRAAGQGPTLKCAP